MKDAFRKNANLGNNITFNSFLFPKGFSFTKRKGLKGVNQFIAATLLILVGIVTALIVSSWVINISSERTSTIVNRTQSQLACQYASMYVSNVTFDCNSNCFTGVPYRINATIENSGSTRLDVYNLFISLTDGTSYRIDSNGTVISTGSVLTKNFNDILVRSVQRMPSESMDVRRAYNNDSNTTGLWHFDEGSGSSTADSAKNNTGTITGASWNGSGRFSRALTFDGINDNVYVNATRFSNSSATVEAWINMNVNNAANNYTIFATSSQISNGHTGLVGLWHFEENSTASGGVKDSSPFGNNGTATNSPYFNISGRFGNAWSFDGIDDSVIVPNNASIMITGDMSAVGWFYIKEFNDYRAILSTYSGNVAPYQWLIQQSSGEMLVYRGNGTVNAVFAGQNAVPRNTSVHLAWTMEGTTVRTYINGLLDKSGTLSTTIANGGQSLYIGRSNSGSYPFNGTIDEVAIYNRSLSAAEVRDLYLGGLSMHKTGDNLRFVAGNISLSYNVSSLSGWHHVAGAYTSAYATLYVDGTPVSTGTNRGLLVLGLDAYIGGMFNSTNNLTFNGSIDEVRISNISRTFNTTLTYDIVHPDIRAVRVYNESGVQIDAQTGLSGNTSSRNITNVTTATDYRVEVTDSTGAVLEKWYPARGGCRARSTLDKITFTTANCPELTDTYYGTDVFFVGCVP